MMLSPLYFFFAWRTVVSREKQQKASSKTRRHLYDGFDSVLQKSQRRRDISDALLARVVFFAWRFAVVVAAHAKAQEAAPFPLSPCTSSSSARPVRKDSLTSEDIPYVALSLKRTLEGGAHDAKNADAARGESGDAGGGRQWSPGRSRLSPKPPCSPQSSKTPVTEAYGMPSSPSPSVTASSGVDASFGASLQRWLSGDPKPPENPTRKITPTSFRLLYHAFVTIRVYARTSRLRHKAVRLRAANSTRDSPRTPTTSSRVGRVTQSLHRSDTGSGGSGTLSPPISPGVKALSPTPSDRLSDEPTPLLDWGGLGGLSADGASIMPSRRWTAISQVVSTQDDVPEVQIVGHAEQVDPSDGTEATMYHIMVGWHGDKWIVTRRFRKFMDLHEGLTAKYPDLMQSLPPPPEKKLFHFLASNLESDRLRDLQSYLVSLVRVPALRASKPLTEFLLDRSAAELWMEILTLRKMLSDAPMDGGSSARLRPTLLHPNPPLPLSPDGTAASTPFSPQAHSQFQSTHSQSGLSLTPPHPPDLYRSYNRRLSRAQSEVSSSVGSAGLPPLVSSRPRSRSSSVYDDTESH
eukprot:Rmarinus@m.12477